MNIGDKTLETTLKPLPQNLLSLLFARKIIALRLSKFNMGAKAVFTSILFLSAFSLVAQRDTSVFIVDFYKPQCNWDYGAGARFTFLDFEKLNRALGTAGLPGLESPVPCLSLAARSSFNWKHWLVETSLEFTSGASKQNAEDRQSVNFRDYALRTRVLFDLLHRQRLTKIFPYAGLGISYQTLHTSRTATGIGTYSQEIQQRQFAQFPLVCEMGLSLERGIAIRKKDLFVGIRVGYAFRFLENQWVVDENTAVPLPNPAAAAPFVAMLLRLKSRR